MRKMVEVFREVPGAAPGWDAVAESRGQLAAGGSGGYSDKSTLAGFTNPDTKDA